MHYYSYAFPKDLLVGKLIVFKMVSNFIQPTKTDKIWSEVFISIDNKKRLDLNNSLHEIPKDW